jgi:hypothetical protein
MRWGVEKRLEFIEFRLFWEGWIRRSHITERFDVSVPQASKDLSLYEEKAPGNLVYDKSVKRYLVSSRFEPKFIRPDADRYLSQLKNIAEDTVRVEDTWLSEVPQAEVMPLPHRRVEVAVLRSVLNAIRAKKSVNIFYQSMNSEKVDPIWRWISPHAFANDGLRWHVRAFCHTDRRFKDFLLSRCLGVEGEKAAEAAASDDVSWNTFFDVILIPNPELSANQRAIIAQDFCMHNGEISISIRKSLLYYFQKRLRLDVARVIDNKKETPVLVQNTAEFERALKAAAQ